MCKRTFGFFMADDIFFLLILIHVVSIHDMSQDKKFKATKSKTNPKLVEVYAFVQRAGFTLDFVHGRGNLLVLTSLPFMLLS